MRKILLECDGWSHFIHRKYWNLKNFGQKGPHFIPKIFPELQWSLYKWDNSNAFVNEFWTSNAFVHEFWTSNAFVHEFWTLYFFGNVTFNNSWETSTINISTYELLPLTLTCTLPPRQQRVRSLLIGTVIWCWFDLSLVPPLVQAYLRCKLSLIFWVWSFYLFPPFFTPQCHQKHYHIWFEIGRSLNILANFGRLPPPLLGPNFKIIHLNEFLRFDGTWGIIFFY